MQEEKAKDDLEQFIEGTLTRVTTRIRSFPGEHPSNNEIAREIACSLRDAGYGKLDTFSLAMQDQLRHGLTGLKENLSKLREGISFIELTEEKCGRILRLLEHERKRRGA